MNIGLLCVPFTVLLALAVFFGLYPEGNEFDFCEGDYCYVCATPEELKDAFPDTSVVNFMTHPEECSPNYAVRFDRP